MIARMWRGWTRAADMDAYLAGLRKRIQDQVTMPGKRGSILLRRRVGDRGEFVTISFWDSLESIRALGGQQVEQAVFFPLDDEFLIERESTVSHFEVGGSEGLAISGSRDPE